MRSRLRDAFDSVTVSNRRVRRMRTVVSHARHDRRAARAPLAQFVWVPKTGGTSVYTALYRYGLERYRSVEQLAAAPGPLRFVTFSHMTLESLLAAELVDPGWASAATRFAFVRNPFDRMVSLYHHMSRHPSWPEFDDTTTFAMYVDRIAEGVEPPGPYENCGLSSANPQVAWTAAAGSPSPVRVWRYERLASDFEDMCRSIGLRPSPLRHNNRSLNRATNDHRSYYDARTRRIVEELYRADLDAFGYDF